MKYFENWKCVGKRKTSYNFGLKKALRGKLGLKMPKTDLAIEEDPFLRLGYGMNAYYVLLRQLATMFILLSLFTLPLMVIYSSYNGLSDQKMYFAN